MKYYNETFIWDCLIRINSLKSFKRLLTEYFRNIQILSLSNVEENKKASQVRSEINKSLQRNFLYVTFAGISVQMYYSPPPVVGGLSGNIDLFANVFNLFRFEINPKYLIDKIEQAIGVYEHERISAWVRTINPLFWTWSFVNWFIELPFKLLGAAGFSIKKAEESFAGKLFKFIFSLAIFISAVLTIIYYLGFLDIVKDFLQKKS